MDRIVPRANDRRLTRSAWCFVGLSIALGIICAILAVVIRHRTANTSAWEKLRCQVLDATVESGGRAWRSRFLVRVVEQKWKSSLEAFYGPDGVYALSEGTAQAQVDEILKSLDGSNMTSCYVEYYKDAEDYRVAMKSGVSSSVSQPFFFAAVMVCTVAFLLPVIFVGLSFCWIPSDPADVKSVEEKETGEKIAAYIREKCIAEYQEGLGDCPICLDELDGDEEIARLTCHHHFHMRCITSWIRAGKGRTCPVCHANLHDLKLPETSTS